MPLDGNVSLAPGKTGVMGLDTVSGTFYTYQNDRIDASAMKDIEECLLEYNYVTKNGDDGIISES